MRNLFFLIFLSAASMAARADTFEYNYSFIVPPTFDLYATFSSPTLITTNTIVTTTTCGFEGKSCESLTLELYIPNFSPGTANIEFDSGVNGFMEDGSILIADSAFNLGDNISFAGEELDVIDIAATPEPPSLALLGTGVVLLAMGVAHQKSRAQSRP